MVECGTACPPTCTTPEPRQCALSCIRGCQCKPGLLRDRHGRCVSPADCEPRHALADPTSAPAHVAFTCPPGKPGNYSTARWNACSRGYVRCGYRGSRTDGLCPEGTVFDAHAAACVPRAASKVCAFDCAGHSNGMYGEGCDAHFWWCWDGLPTRHLCVRGTFFSKEADECTFFDDVPACTHRAPAPTTTRAPIQTTPAPKMDCSAMPDGDYADPDGGCPPHFYVCSNGYAFKKFCPYGLTFDPTRKLCDYKDRIADCGAAQAQPSKPNSYVCPQPKGDFADPLRPCTGYYWWCMGGHPMYTRCERNMIFNPATGLCDRRRNVLGCNGRFVATGGRDDAHLYGRTTTTTTTTTTPTPATIGTHRTTFPVPLTYPNRQETNRPFNPQTSYATRRPRISTTTGGRNVFDLPRATTGSRVPLIIYTTRQSTPRNQVTTTARPFFIQTSYATRRPQPSTVTGVRDDANLYERTTTTTTTPTLPTISPPRTTFPVPLTYPNRQETGPPFNPQTSYATRRPRTSTTTGGRNVFDPSRATTDRRVPLIIYTTRQSTPRDQVTTTIRPFFTKNSYATRRQPSSVTDGRNFLDPSRTTTDRRVPLTYPTRQSTIHDQVTTTVRPFFTKTSYATRRPQPSFVISGRDDSHLYGRTTTTIPTTTTPTPPTIGPHSTTFPVPLTYPNRQETGRPFNPQTSYATRLPRISTTTNGRTVFDLARATTDSRVPFIIDTTRQSTPREQVTTTVRPFFTQTSYATRRSRISTSTGGPNVFDLSRATTDRSVPLIIYTTRQSTPVQVTTTVRPFFTKNSYTTQPSSVTEGRNFFDPSRTTTDRRVPLTYPTQQPSTFPTQQPSTYPTQQPSTYPTQQPSYSTGGPTSPVLVVANDPKPATVTNNHCAGQADGTLIAFGPCGLEYCECQEEKPLLRVCEEGQVFGLHERSCVAASTQSECGVADETVEVDEENHCAEQEDGTLIAFGPCSVDFCECQNEKPILRSCETGLVFSTDQLTCVYPKQIPECPTVADDPDQAEVTKNHCEGQVDGTLIAFGPCGTEYCECQAEKPLLRVCDDDQVFGLSERSCVAASSKSECGVADETVEVEEENHCAEQEDGTLISFGPCNLDYCECQNEKPILRSCETGLVFSTPLRSCVYPKEIPECPEVADDPEPTAPDAENHCAGQLDGTLIAFGPCGTEYCECLGEKALLRVCDEDQVFGLNERTCVAASTQSECSVADVTVEVEEENHCSNQEDGTLIAFGPCGLDFCECQNEKPILRTCETGLVFSVTQRICVYPKQIPECPTVADDPEPAAESENHCANQADGTLIAFGPCGTEYCECQAEKPLLRVCDEGQVFGLNERSCVATSSQSECIVADETVEEEEENHCADQEDGTLIAFGPCSLDFCECQSEKPILRSCETGLVFSTAQRTCVDPKEIAECPMVVDDSTAMTENHCAGQADGTLIAFGCCKVEYCECQAEKSLLRVCGAGEVFGLSDRSCVPASLECSSEEETLPEGPV